jgi:formylglycine-generating enzyme
MTQSGRHILVSVTRRGVLQIAAVVAGFGASALADDGLPNQGAAPDFAGTKAGQIRVDDRLHAKLVWIPAGTFTMGSRADEADRREDEKQVDVRITAGFWLGQCEVTQSEWTHVMHTTPWKGRISIKEGDNFAASYVSWNDATTFCQQLTAAERNAGRLPTDWKFTLPTEAQWEYACRAGTTTRFSCGADDASLIDHGWFDKNTSDPGDQKLSRFARSRARTTGQRYAHQVGLKAPNPWGLHDMHGNVYEWCRDTYLKDLPGGDDPEVSAAGPLRIVRGGSWVLGSKLCRSANRDWNEPTERQSSLGFRVAVVRSAN